MSHTPGPWYASGVLIDADGWTSCTVGPFAITEGADEHYEDTIAYVSGINYTETLEANARLIAAAPDLVKALRQFVAHYPAGTNPYLDTAAAMARAALAKVDV
jgi:hypothetical protein